MLGFVQAVPAAALLSVVGYLGALVGFFGVSGPAELPSGVVGEEQIMARKDHGTCPAAPEKPLRWGSNSLVADKISCYNRNFAEFAGYWEKTDFLKAEGAASGEINFYDSVTGKKLFVAPRGRSFDDFVAESRLHGWPSFRDNEVVAENVRVLPGGETVSVDGTHLGHNLPDRRGNRYCINLVSISGKPRLETALGKVASVLPAADAAGDGQWGKAVDLFPRGSAVGEGQWSRVAGVLPKEGAAGAGVISDGPVVTPQSLGRLEEEQADLFQRVVPSVVYIGTELNLGGQQPAGEVDPNSLPKGVGSGFVWDKKGHIVTNFHVINNVEKAFVYLTKPDGTQTRYVAKLTGVDPDRDVAVLKIDAPEKDLAVIPVGDSTKTRVGEMSFAVGNPFGQDHTLTTGVISGKNRQISAPTGRKIAGCLQTDASINPGNSGGPLLDSQGRLIGINTASLGAGAGVSAGIAFAVPIEIATPSITQLIETGQVQRAVLGISYLDRLPTPEESAKDGLPAVTEGVVVLEVLKGSGSAAGGMIPIQKPAQPAQPGGKSTLGDVIVGINGDKVKEPKDLNAILAKYKPQDTVDIKVRRGNEQKEQTLKVTLGAFQSSTFSKLENERGPAPAAQGAAR